MVAMKKLLILLIAGNLSTQAMFKSGFICSAALKDADIKKQEALCSTQPLQLTCLAPDPENTNNVLVSILDLNNQASPQERSADVRKRQYLTWLQRTGAAAGLVMIGFHLRNQQNAGTLDSRALLQQALFYCGSLAAVLYVTARSIRKYTPAADGPKDVISFDDAIDLGLKKGAAKELFKKQIFERAGGQGELPQYVRISQAGSSVQLKQIMSPYFGLVHHSVDPECPLIQSFEDYPAAHNGKVTIPVVRFPQSLKYLPILFDKELLPTLARIHQYNTPGTPLNKFETEDQSRAIYIVAMPKPADDVVNI